MIIALDDFGLGSTSWSAYPQRWHSFIASERETETDGWCVDVEWFSSQSVPQLLRDSCSHPAELEDYCCIPHKTKTAACFASSDLSTQGCLQIENVLLPANRTRCTTSCSDGQTCISPAPQHPLTKIYVQNDSPYPRIVMFAGSRLALGQQVKVSMLKPMFGLPVELIPEDFLW